jgi:hypothetical protein
MMDRGFRISPIGHSDKPMGTDLNIKIAKSNLKNNSTNLFSLWLKLLSINDLHVLLPIETMMQIRAPRGMGRSDPIPWDDFFLNIPSHPMVQKLSVKILDLLIYWGKNNFTDVNAPFGHSSGAIKEIIVFYSLSDYAA